MQFDVVTLFPELINAWSCSGVCGKAFKKNIVQVDCWNPRNYVIDPRRDIDDRPYGGGPGMVMLAAPLKSTLSAIKKTLNFEKENKVILFSPIGKKIDQNLIEKFVTNGHQNYQLSLICGRYEGIDQRFVDLYVDEIWSLGDFVNTGGELAAMVFMDALIRRLPGSLGNANSSLEDSFINGLLDYPHYSRPEKFESISVPDVLLSGHHAKIKEWRRLKSLEITNRYRLDLIEKAREDGNLSVQDEKWLATLENKVIKED
jgi:tRNA (guanine37-N1)-methyltransferase